jgi:hypothetical protein
MKSTGEVMGVGRSFGEAFVKSQTGLWHVKLADSSGTAFIVSVKNGDKPKAWSPFRRANCTNSGFKLIATQAALLQQLSCTGHAGDRDQQSDRKAARTLWTCSRMAKSVLVDQHCGRKTYARLPIHARSVLRQWRRRSRCTPPSKVRARLVLAFAISMRLESYALQSFHAELDA